MDPCSFAPDDPAKIMLPTGEYQVYARILGKPGKVAGERSVVFFPKLIDACDTLGTADFATYTECQDDALLTAGKITVNGVFDKDSATLDRVAPLKGANKAQNITSLFQWSGYVCDAILDINGDGEISVADVGDLNADGLIDAADLALFLEQNCQFFENEWVFNIADMVTYGWDYMNSGSKLVQVRLYPMKTTEFVSSAVTTSAPSGTSPLTVKFTAGAYLESGAEAKSYSWRFSDGTTAIGKSVKHTFVNKTKKTKTYSVSLLRRGKKDTQKDKLLVTVLPK